MGRLVMTLEVRKYPSEIDVLWDYVIIVGDSQDEVQGEMIRMMESSGNASFCHPQYRKVDRRWMSTGQVMRPH